MKRVLCTIGFTGKTAEQFFALLREAGVEAVVDVRQNRAGQLSAFAKYPDLEFFLRDILGAGYRHEDLLAPTPEIRKAYQESKNWGAYESAFLKLMKQRRVPAAVDTSKWPAKVALLCTEPGPEKCHRRLAADLLAEHWRAKGDEVEVRHLVLGGGAKNKRIKARGDDAELGVANAGVGGANAAVGDASAGIARSNSEEESRRAFRPAALTVAIAGSGAALGSRCVASEDVDRAFGMPTGKLRSRAGIESLRYAAEGENELTLGAAAMRRALSVEDCEAKAVDCIIATSETHREYPSLAAQLHKYLGLRENCAAVDVGGACLGLLNGLAAGQALIAAGQAKTVAVVTADVHSATLKPGRVAGEFGGLFGDGASAFVLQAGSTRKGAGAYRLGRFVFGCASQYAEAIRVRDGEDGGLAVQFDGEALSRAAITRMERILAMVETDSGISRKNVGAFATHQPNPRLVTLLAKQCGVPAAAFPAVARTAGNLGSSTCGVALHEALDTALKLEACHRKAIFMASLGPGLVFGGGWLSTEGAGSSLDL